MYAAAHAPHPILLLQGYVRLGTTENLQPTMEQDIFLTFV